MQTRDEHLAWCKEEALKYVEKGDVTSAFVALLKGLGEHPETKDHAGIKVGLSLALIGCLSTEQEMRTFIKGVR